MVRKACMMVLFAMAAGALSAQSPAASPWKASTGFSRDWDHLHWTVTPIADGVSVLHGSGGNTLLLTGSEGSLLIDPSFAQVAPSLTAKLQALHVAPVKFVIDTHYHSDHAGGSGSWGATGAVVVAHEAVRERLSKPQHNAQRQQPAAPAESLPKVTYTQEMWLRLDGETIRLEHVAAAHTDGDTVVYLQRANAIHLGDVFINGMYPYVDVNAGGTIDGYFPVLDAALVHADAHTRIVPGHGDVTDRARLAAYRAMLQTVRDRVAALIEKGATLEEVWAAHPSREFDAEWASDRMTPEDLAAMIYQSLTHTRLDYKPGLLR